MADELPPPPTISELLASLRSSSPDDREFAVVVLSELVAAAYGDDGAAVGAAVRAGAGVPVLSWLMTTDPSPEIRLQALQLIGNLCSDAVDVRSAETKALLLRAGAEHALVAALQRDLDDEMLVLACATLQNLCHEPEWARAILRHGAPRRLEAIVEEATARAAADDGGGGAAAHVLRYASGALSNIARCLASADPDGTAAVQLGSRASAALEARAQQRAVEEFAQRRAARRLRAAVAARRAAMPEAAPPGVGERRSLLGC